MTCVLSDGDVVIRQKMNPIGETSFPIVKSKGSITFQHAIDLSDPPPSVTMCYTNCKCKGKFTATKKITEEQIIQITNCEFPEICGPFEMGTILEIDDDSKFFANLHRGISGFPIIRNI
jgi:hypothetical protein